MSANDTDEESAIVDLYYKSPDNSKNPDYIEKHELLVHISKMHSEWIKDAESRTSPFVKGISIGNAMALEELHKFVKTLN